MSEEKSEIDSSKYLSEIDRPNERRTNIEKDKIVSIPKNKKLEVESSKHFQNVLPLTSTNPNDYDPSKEMIFEHLAYNPEAIVEELIFVPETTHFSTKKKATKKLNLSKIFSNKGIMVIFI